MVTDTLGNRTELVYDRRGRKVEMVDPDMGRWYYGYDAAGNVITQTDSLHQEIQFAYDPLNRLTQKSQVRPVSQTLAVYGYDYNNQDPASFPIGRRTAMAGPSGQSLYYYDARGRVTREAQTVGWVAPQTTYTTTYGYGMADAPLTITYPDGEVVTNGWDSGGRAFSVEGLAPYVVGASFNAVGQPKGLSLGDGVIQTHYGYYGYNYEGWQDAYDTAPSSLWHIGRVYRITTTWTVPHFDIGGFNAATGERTATGILIDCPQAEE